MELSPTALWLLAGALFVAAEMAGTSGIGFLFVGLGSITTGTLISLGLIGEEATLLQFTVCFAATIVWGMLLWKVVQKSRLGKESYSNIVGETAYVGSSGVSKTHGGEVTWSGTIMRAEIAPGVDIMRLEPGTQVTIVEVKGARLIVRPKA